MISTCHIHPLEGTFAVRLPHQLTFSATHTDHSCWQDLPLSQKHFGNLRCPRSRPRVPKIWNPPGQSLLLWPAACKSHLSPFGRSHYPPSEVMTQVREKERHPSLHRGKRKKQPTLANTFNTGGRLTAQEICRRRAGNAERMVTTLFVWTGQALSPANLAVGCVAPRTDTHNLQTSQSSHCQHSADGKKAAGPDLPSRHHRPCQGKTH